MIYGHIMSVASSRDVLIELSALQLSAKWCEGCELSDPIQTSAPADWLHSQAQRVIMVTMLHLGHNKRNTAWEISIIQLQYQLMKYALQVFQKRSLASEGIVTWFTLVWF